MGIRKFFRELLEDQWARGNFVCVGLDSELTKIPPAAQISSATSVNIKATILNFNQRIVDATKDLVCAYKPNLAFYVAHGRSGGVTALRETIRYIHEEAPEIPVILDAKVADIGNTNIGYVQRAFEDLNADAVTVHPYLGREALAPFLERAEKGIFVLCRTSNEGAGEFQDLHVSIPREELDYLADVRGAPWSSDVNGNNLTTLSNHVAYRVSKHWNGNGNCALVVGAPYPIELESIRRIAGDMPILIPGIGAQGGDLEKAVAAGKDSRGRGMIINSSRGIIFASSGDDFAEAARRETQKLHNAIQACLTKEVTL